MKKRIVRFGVLLLTVAMMFTLVACGGTQGKIKKNFEKEGYTVTTVSLKDEEIDKVDSEIVKGYLKAMKQSMNEEDLKKAEKWEIIFVTKDLNMGIIIAYPSEKELKEDAGDEYDKYVKDGLINGNCVITPLALDYKSMLEIFKK